VALSLGLDKPKELRQWFSHPKKLILLLHPEYQWIALPLCVAWTVKNSFYLKIQKKLFLFPKRNI